MKKRIQPICRCFAAGTTFAATFFVAVAPLLHTIHLSTCHAHHGCLKAGHAHAALHASLAENSTGHREDSHNNTPHHDASNCPTCQALKAIAQGFVLIEAAPEATVTPVCLVEKRLYPTPIVLYCRETASPRAPPVS